MFRERKKVINKQELQNYNFISLLSISSKILKRLLKKNMFRFFAKNSGTLHNKSGLTLDNQAS